MALGRVYLKTVWEIDQEASGLWVKEATTSSSAADGVPVGSVSFGPFEDRREALQFLANRHAAMAGMMAEIREHVVKNLGVIDLKAA